MLEDIFRDKVVFNGNFVNLLDGIKEYNQLQTADVFSEKWVTYNKDVKEKEQQFLYSPK